MVWCYECAPPACFSWNDVNYDFDDDEPDGDEVLVSFEIRKENLNLFLCHHLKYANLECEEGWLNADQLRQLAMACLNAANWLDTKS